MTRSDIIDISCHLIHETEKAWLIDDGDQQVWIPKAAGELDLSTNPHILSIPERLAQEKGLI